MELCGCKQATAHAHVLSRCMRLNFEHTRNSNRSTNISQQRKSNSNLLHNSQNTRNRSRLLRAEWYPSSFSILVEYNTRKLIQITMSILPNQRHSWVSPPFGWFLVREHGHLTPGASQWQGVAVRPWQYPSKGVRGHIRYHRRWNQGRSKSLKEPEDRTLRTHRGWTQCRLFLRHALKTSCTMFIPHDNVTLAYKILQISKSRGICWLQIMERECSKSVHKLKNPLVRDIWNARATETFGSSKLRGHLKCATEHLRQREEIETQVTNPQDVFGVKGDAFSVKKPAALVKTCNGAPETNEQYT